MKLIRTTLAITTAAIMLTGCSTAQNNASDAASVQPTHMEKYKVLDWYKKPGTVGIDDFEDIALIAKSNGYTGYTEQTGYSPLWLDVNATDLVGGKQYTDNAIIGGSHGKKYIYNFSGKQITKEPFKQFYRDEILGLYGYDSDLSSDDVHYFGQDFNMHTTTVNGVGGDIANSYAVYCDGKVYHDYNQVSSAADYASLLPTILPVKTRFDISTEQQMSTDSSYTKSFQPDGYVVLEKDTDPVMIPEGMTPSYAPLVSNKDVWDDKDFSYNTSFVNGCIKLLDQNDKVHLWHFSTKKYISDQAFDDATFFEDNVIGVCKNDKWAFMDSNGKLITDYIFDKVSGSHENLAYATYHGKVGILRVEPVSPIDGCEWESPEGC